jgi:hypothetical protein
MKRIDSTVIDRIRELTVRGTLEPGQRDELERAIELLDQGRQSRDFDLMHSAVTRIAKVFVCIDLH